VWRALLSQRPPGLREPDAVGEWNLLLGGAETHCRSAAPRGQVRPRRRRSPPRGSSPAAAREYRVHGTPMSRTNWGRSGTGDTRPHRARRQTSAPRRWLGRPHYAASEATGGLCAGAGHRVRWVRIFSITAGCSMNAMMRMGPANRGHTSGSASYPCVMRHAHARVVADGLPH
jgi:hypothetical protein